MNILKKFANVFGVLAALAVLFIAIFAVGRKLLKKKTEGETVEPVL